MLVTLVVVAAAAWLAVGALLYLMQRSYLYYPTIGRADVPSLVMENDGERIVVSLREGGGAGAVVYFGGNAEDVSRSLPELAAAFPDATIYAMHYRGYGGSTGAPTERGLVSDAFALFRLARERHGTVVLVGRSLGSGLAVRVAAEERPAKLVLVTPYDSIAGIAARHFPLFPTRWMLKDRYESWRYAGTVTAPTTIVIAADDEVIPRWSSDRLAAAFAPGVASVVVIPGSGHNDLSLSPDYVPALAR